MNLPLSESYVRERNQKRRASRPFGLGVFQRIALIVSAMHAHNAAKTKAEKARIRIPGPGRQAKHIAPSLFRRASARKGLPQFKALPDQVLVSTDGKKHYMKLSNGQIIRAYGSFTGGLRAHTPAQTHTLNKADLEIIPTLNLIRL